MAPLMYLNPGLHTIDHQYILPQGVTGIPVSYTHLDVYKRQAYGHYAIKAIECSALAYLLKPVSSQKLHEAIEKARMKSNPLQHSLQRNVLEEQLSPAKEPTRFLINTVEDTKVIRFDEVVCCVAESNYTKIHLSDGSKVLASKTLKDFETILYQPHFFRIHHSYLINLNYIRRIIKRCV